MPLRCTSSVATWLVNDMLKHGQPEINLSADRVRDSSLLRVEKVAQALKLAEGTRIEARRG